ncbi:aquaporin, partial [Streptococcus suis]
GCQTGPGLNPARDLGPRIVHALIPKSVLGENKSDSKWWYAWVGVCAPIIASSAAVALFKFLYLEYREPVSSGFSFS